MPPWALVTPASRGISLQVARRLLAHTHLPIVATARTDLDRVRGELLQGQAGGDALEQRLHVLRMDVKDEDSIAEAARECQELFTDPSHLHAAFVMPGILHPEKSPTALDAAKVLDTFQVNVIGPMLVMKHFSPFLPRKATQMPNQDSVGDALPAAHATWLNMSARVGSIADNSLGGWYSYRSSKAAVVQVTRTFDAHLKTAAGDKALAAAYHPGTVKTGLSKDFWGSVKPDKLFSPEYAAEKLIEVVGSFGGRVGDVRGRCWDWKGDEVPP